jgi:hypothetical protein
MSLGFLLISGLSWRDRNKPMSVLEINERELVWSGTQTGRAPLKEVDSLQYSRHFDSDADIVFRNGAHLALYRLPVNRLHYRALFEFFWIYSDAKMFVDDKVLLRDSARSIPSDFSRL